MSSDSLRYYYQHLYPYNAMYKWLTYNNSLAFDHRQLSFEYPNECVQRYVKFKSAEEMKARMTSVDEQAPRKVDAGAVWTGPPAKDNKQFKPMQRQFIFDFDMDDYDDVRTCCTGKDTCESCWKFMLVAKDIITTTLKQDFGFSKFMYVFSGGRGMHIWVCDEQARTMPDSLRKSIVDYLQVVTGNSKGSSLLAENTIPTISKVFHRNDSKNKEALKQQILSMMNPHISRSIKIISKWFKQIFNKQGSIKNVQCQQVIFRIIENRSKKLLERVKQRWSKCLQNLDTMWLQMCEEIEHYQMAATDDEYPLKSHELNFRKYQRMTFIQQEIFLSFLYPRMDQNVSTTQNHLLKLPFSIHPKTQKVSVPLFSQDVQKFNPKACVTLENLMKQLWQLEKQGIIDYKDTAENARKTLLSQHLSALEYFCSDM